MSSQLNRNLNTVDAKGSSLFDRIFRDSEGNVVIAQPPNLPLLLALAATILQFILSSGNLQTAASLVAFGTWYTWAWLEIFQGVNYFRRGLGLIVFVSLLVLALSGNAIAGF